MQRVRCQPAALIDARRHSEFDRPLCTPFARRFDAVFGVFKPAHAKFGMFA
jgi:hypothetical protein